MRLRDEQGMMAIGVALMLIVVLALFGGVLWQYSMAEMKRVERTEQDLQALFLARAGAEAVMAAWLEESVSDKPEGPIDRIYYNLGNNEFQTTIPSNSLGYVDVVVTKITDQNSPKYQLTDITATAVVQGVTRAATVTTYPFRQGHDEDLKWYTESDGEIRNSSYSRVDELVIIRARKGVHFDKRAGFAEMVYQAPWILFESPLDMGHDQEDEWLETVDYYDHNLIVAADVIFFQDVFLKDLPTLYSRPALKSTVTLKLPEDSPGISGETIIGADPNGKYGKVYFDGNEAKKKVFEWKRTWFIVYFYKIKYSKSTQLRASYPSGQLLERNAFYFRDGTNLMNPQPKELIPLSSEERRSNLFKNLKPFVWE